MINMDRTNLIKHNLDFSKTYPYFLDHIDWNISLSNSIVKNIDFQKGNFYTLQPDNANLEKLYKFKQMGILPQNIPFKKGNSIWQEVPNIDKEIADLIFDYLSGNENNFVFMDHYFGRVKDRDLLIESVNLILFKEEIYYLLQNPALKEGIINAIKTTQNIVHSILLFGKELKKTTVEDEDDFDDISKNAVIIGTTAYDGEGFIFWEKNNRSMNFIEQPLA